MAHSIFNLEIDAAAEHGRKTDIDSVRWGEIWEFGSPNYWRHRYSEVDEANWEPKLGSDLKEEIVACMLGGYGIPAEVALAAFDRVRNSSALMASPATPEEIYELLAAPLSWVRRDGSIGSGKYRFARQRSERIASAMRKLDLGTPPKGEVILRDWLLSLPGIGMKTASWIVRNHLDSDKVAIVDIHLMRAGRLAGIFPATWTLPKDYRRFEQAFLAFSRSIDARPSILDSLIWSDMRISGIHGL